MRSLAVFLAAALACGIGAPCCVTYGGNQAIELSGEKAIIVWDAENHKEHFIRQASFKGEAKDFGFVVPSPSKPEVAEADAGAFSILDRLVPRPNTVAKGLDDAASDASLVDQYRVGDYEVSILKASDGAAMIDWLKTNDYTNRPAMEPWLDYYAKMGWYFAALKFVRKADSTAPETKAVRVSFETNEPFYPYKMPTDTWPKGHFRPMALYFVSYGTARATYRGTSKDWEAKIRWSGKLPRKTAPALAEAIGLQLMDIPADATVTVFENTENAQGYDRDLKFDTYTVLVPTWALGVIALAIVAGIVYVVRTRKKSDAV